jgi:hypothetical protein
LDLIRRHDFNLRLSSVKFDCAGDAYDFPLERGDLLVGRYFGPGRNEPSERLIGVFVVPPKKRTRNSRFSLLCCRRNRVTLSPEPPGIFRFGLAPAGTGPGPVGCP